MKTGIYHPALPHCAWVSGLIVTGLLLGAIVYPLAIPAVAQNLPAQVEALRGNVWNGSECCNWEFTWTHKSGPFFSAQWRNSNGQQMSDNNIVINIWGDDNVEIIRGGGSEAGGCTYQGKIRVGSASGDYWCNRRHAGTWGAAIR